MLLKKLDKIIEKKGLLQVSIELGYKSTSAIGTWVRNKRIPPIAEKKLKEYLNENNKR